MANQKTTLKRYAGEVEGQKVWDKIYLASTSDIVLVGQEMAIQGDATGFGSVTSVLSTKTAFEVIQSIIDRLKTVDGTILPNLANGTGITALSGAVINSGTVGRAYLPADVSGKGIEVATEALKDALTTAQVNSGDIVKVTGGAAYVANVSGSTITYVQLSDEAATVAWNKITGVPTVIGSGTGELNLTNAVKTGDLVDSGGVSNAAKPVKTNAAGKLAFDITGDAATLESHGASYFATASDLSALSGVVGETTDTSSSNTVWGDINQLKDDVTNASTITKGVLPLSVIPKGAIEELFTVSSLSILASSSNTGYPSNAGNGDTIQVDPSGNDENKGKMYFVTDDTKLGTNAYMDGLRVYTAGSAASVDWSGVQNKPTTLSGYGITDAVNSSLVSETSAAGKLVVVNSSNKLPVSITGDAATLESHGASYFATASDLSALSNAFGTEASGNDPATGLVADVRALETTVGDSNSGLVKDAADLRTDVGVNTTGSETGIFAEIKNLKAGTTITALDGSKITGTVARANLPSDISGRVFEYETLVAAQAALTAQTAAKGDLVKVSSTGQLYAVIDDTKLDLDAGYKLLVDIGNTTIQWNKITGVPTTIGSGTGELNLTNAVLTTDTIVDALAVGAVTANKIPKISSTDGKLHVNIAGDAMTLESHSASYFATASDLATVSLRAPMILASESELTSPTVGQLALIPVS